MVSFRPLVAAIYRKFDRVIAVSEPLARELKALYRLPSRRITHIENFVERQEPTPRLPSDGVRRFVWCGRLVTEKNVEGLLHAWRDFVQQDPNGVQLVVLGDGALRDTLIALAGDLGLRVGRTVEDGEAQVVFTGRVSDPAAYMTGASALVLTSRAEGLPMALLEALSLGVPVLASDCESGGVRSALVGEGVCDPRRSTRNMVRPARYFRFQTSPIHEACAFGGRRCARRAGTTGRRFVGGRVRLRAPLCSPKTQRAADG